MTGPTHDVGLVSRILFEMLADKSFKVELDTQNGPITVPPEIVAHPRGMLPIFLIAADAIWTRDTGQGFGIELEADPDALFCYRAQAVHGGPMSAILLGLADVLDHRDPNSHVSAQTLIDAWSAAPAGASPG